MTKLSPNWVSPPGETIQDVLDERGWTQREFALRTGFTTKHVNQLISGSVPLTSDAARILSDVLGSTIEFWMTRESQYRDALIREKQIAELSSEAEWVKRFPVNEMVKMGWMDRHNTVGEKALELVRYFGVSSPATWEATYGTLRCAERAELTRRDDHAVAAWLRQCEIQTQRVDCDAWDKRGFESVVKAARSMTTEPRPGVFLPKLRQECAAVGVAVVVVKAPPKCPLHGATKWAGAKAMLALSARRLSDDQLWFSFFHEAAHLILHSKKKVFLEEQGLDDADEREANVFARDLLIPPSEWPRLQGTKKSKDAVKRFAADLGIAPGIIVGQLRHHGHIPHTHFHDLVQRYQWGE